MGIPKKQQCGLIGKRDFALLTGDITWLKFLKDSLKSSNADWLSDTVKTRESANFLTGKNAWFNIVTKFDA